MSFINKLLIFDLDGTIIDVFGCGRRALNSTMKELFNIDGAGEKLDFSSATDYGILLDLNETYDLHGNLFRRLDEFQRVYSAELRNEIEINQTSRLLPGFPELLEYLTNDTNYFSVIATGNMKVGAETKMSYFHINKYFPVGDYGDNDMKKKDIIHSSYKKAKTFYRNGFKKEDTFVIGDTTRDIKAANNLGFNSIAVTTGLERKNSLIQSKPNWLLDTLSPIEKLTNLLS